MVIYLDTGDLAEIEKRIANPLIWGVTTNPTLIKQAGVKDYRSYAKTVLGMVGEKDVSFEVLADDEETMIWQALEIASWGKNVHVKIPVCHTDGSSTEALINKLDKQSVRLNVTAIMTSKQIRDTTGILTNNDHIISVFAGRISDTGAKANDVVKYARRMGKKTHRILWASARQIFDYNLALKVSCDIITLSPALLDKFSLQGKSLREYSMETVQQFHRDGKGIEF